MGRRGLLLVLSLVALGVLASWPRRLLAQPPRDEPKPLPTESTPVVNASAGAPAPASPPRQPAELAPTDERVDEAPAAPRQDEAVQHPGERLSIAVLTFGPGDHPFFKFGHNAIWVHDGARMTDRVYNYGTFAFSSRSIFVRFWLGRFRYRLSRAGLNSTLRSYQRHNRSVAIQQLDLTPDERWRLNQFLLWNHRKENRYYQYHYYRDNCSTRVRDAIDSVIGGRIRAATRGPGGMTYRDHTLRLTADLPPLLIALHVVMGDGIDQPISEWEEMFLPERLRQLLRQVTVIRDGKETPLVASERQIFEADRPPAPGEPPQWLVYFLAAGVSCGGLLALAGRAGRRRRVARVLAGTGLLFVGLLFGTLGTGFCLLWALTNHEVAYANENILHLAPWLMALVVLAVGVARGRQPAIRRAFVLTAAATATSTLGLALKILPWFDQHNGEVIAFALPVVAGAALATWWLHDESRSPLDTAVKSPAPSGPS